MVETGISEFPRRRVRFLSGSTPAWFGWAQRNGTRLEADLRMFKFLARFDAWRLKKELA